MIYVYVNGKRMAYLQNLLQAESLMDENIQPGDVLIFPVLDKQQRELPLKKGKLALSKIENCTLFLPFPYSFVQENNSVFYYMRETSVIEKNSYLTALGMIAYLSELPINVLQDQIDIIGYGKCGKAISEACKVLSIPHRVIRRNSEQGKWMDIDAYKTSKKGKVIINTAPTNYLSIHDINSEETNYIIDIASDKVFPKSWAEKGIQILYPGSLPDRFAPFSAANVIYEYVKEKVNER